MIAALERENWYLVGVNWYGGKCTGNLSESAAESYGMSKDGWGVGVPHARHVEAVGHNKARRPVQEKSPAPSH